MSLRTLDIWLDGTDIAYASRAGRSRSRRRSSSSATATADARGNIDIVEGRYAQNFDLAGMIFTPKRTNEVAEPFWQGIPLLETMRLNLRAQSRGSLVREEQHRRPAADRVARRLGHAVRAAPRRADHAGGGRAHLPARLPLHLRHRRGQVRFEAEKKIPEETPTIDLSATTTYIDNFEQQHELILKLTGTALSPRLDLGSTEGWSRNRCCRSCFLGQSPDDIRRISQGAPTATRSARRAAPPPTPWPRRSPAPRSASSSPTRCKRQIGLDVVNLQFGGSSVQLDACKRIEPRTFKACGQGEIGFTGASRFGGSIELRITDRPGRARRRRPHRVPHPRRRYPAGLADLRTWRAPFARSARILRYSRDGLVRAARHRRCRPPPGGCRARAGSGDEPPTPPKSTPSATGQAVVVSPATSPSAVAAAQEGATQRLAAVDLRGDIHENQERLLKFLGLTAGAPFGQEDQTRLDAELKALGYRQLATEIEPLGGGLVRLHLTLEPVRIVRNVIVKHNWPLFDDEIIRHLSLRTGHAAARRRRADGAPRRRGRGGAQVPLQRRLLRGRRPASSRTSRWSACPASRGRSGSISSSRVDLGR